MKFLMFFISACIFAVCQAKVDDKQIKKACAEETKADLGAILDMIKNSKWSGRDTKVDCYFFCLAKKLGEINDEGVFNYEKAKENLLEAKIEPDKIHKVLNKCKDSKGSTPCATAGKLAECYFREKDFKLDSEG